MRSVRLRASRLEPRDVPSVVLVGESMLSTTTLGGQARPSVAADGVGNFVVSWTYPGVGKKGSGSGIVVRQFDAQGVAVGEEVSVNQHTTGNQLNSAVALDGAGNFVVVWQSEGQDGSGSGVYARRFDAAGQPRGDEFRVNQFTANNQQTPVVGMSAGGDFVVAWASDFQDGSFDAVVARRYNSAGVAQGNEFVVNQYTTGQQRRPAIAVGSAGDFVIAWESSNFGQPAQDGSGSAIAARRYNRFGEALGNEFVANAESTGSQTYPSVAMTAGGDFVIAWIDGPSVEFRRFTANAAPESGDLIAADGLSGPVFTGLALGGDGLITLTFNEAGTSYVRVVDESGVPRGEWVKVGTKGGTVSAVAGVARVGGQVIAVRAANGIHASRFAVRRPTEFVLFSGGFLWRRDGTTWANLTSNVAAVSNPVLDWYGRSVVGVRFHNGAAYQYTSDGTWTNLGGGVTAVAPGRETTFVAYDAGGLWRFHRANNTWSTFSGGFVSDVTVGYSSSLGGEYVGVLFQGGFAWSRNFLTGWYSVASGVRQIAAMPDATFAVVFSNGGLWTRGAAASGTWSSLTANVREVAVGTGPFGNGAQLDVLYNGGSVWSYSPAAGTWTGLTNNVSRLIGPADGRSFVLFNGGFLWTRDDGGDWGFVAGNVI